MNITEFILINTMTILFNFIAVYMLKYMNTEKPGAFTEDSITEENPDGVEEETVAPFKAVISRNLMFVVFMLIMNLTLCNILTAIYDNHLAIDLKLMFLITILWPIALIDYKEKRIPNTILKILLLARVLFLVPEMIIAEKLTYLFLSMLIAAVAIFIASMACCFLMKNSIGMGDVKLFIIMALYMGLEGIWSAIFCALLVSFFIAIYLLASKKVKRKDSIPFAPAILAGAYLAVFLTGL